MKNPLVIGVIGSQLDLHEQVHDETIVQKEELVNALVSSVASAIDATCEFATIEYAQKIRGWVNLRLLDKNGKVVRTVGIVLPGEYDFGVHEHDETIHVIEGAFVVDAGCYIKGQEFQIKAGESAVILVTVPSVYTRT